MWEGRGDGGWEVERGRGSGENVGDVENYVSIEGVCCGNVCQKVQYTLLASSNSFQDHSTSMCTEKASRDSSLRPTPAQGVDHVIVPTHYLCMSVYTYSIVVPTLGGPWKLVKLDSMM